MISVDLGLDNSTTVRPLSINPLTTLRIPDVSIMVLDEEFVALGVVARRDGLGGTNVIDQLAAYLSPAKLGIIWIEQRGIAIL